MYDKFFHNGNLAETLEHAKHARTEFAWILHRDVDYSNFDLHFVPNRFEYDQAHVWSSHNNVNSHTTWLVPRQYTDINYHDQVLPIANPIPRITVDVASIEVMRQHTTTEWQWICDSRIDYSDFNFDWLPDSSEDSLVHCFEVADNIGYTWLVNSNCTDIRYHKSNLKFKELPHTVAWPNFAFESLTGTDWNDSLANWLLAEDIQSEWVWVIDTRVDYTKFNFTWLPAAWDTQYIHCFAMKDKEQLSYTWLVNTASLKDKQYKFIKSDLQFIDRPDIVLLDMGLEANSHDFKQFTKRLRFTGTMEAMLHSAVKRATTEWLFVISNCCDYWKFDFDWLPDLDQINHTHCWPSNDQLKGDTFLIHIPSYMQTREFRFNFDHDSVHRLPWPPHIYEEDSLAAAMNSHLRSASLYVAYYKRDSIIKKFPTPCLWENRPVVGMNVGNSVSLVPRDCVVKDEVYEYPYLENYIDYADHDNLDVVFIHNGEKDASINMAHCSIKTPHNMSMKVSSGVNGRLKAYQAAANMSNTAWFLAVFAKCHMKDDYANFDWRPDYWQKPKHYIFHNHNLDLDLTYGHMAPIAYNKRLMLENTGGLDMTLAQEHAVIPIVLSDTYLTDPWDIWRTAFRETVKLMYYARTDESIELKYRLHIWLNAEQTWYKNGAQAARDFFESVNGDWGWIMVTNEWDWLRKRFNALYPTAQL